MTWNCDSCKATVTFPVVMNQVYCPYCGEVMSVPPPKPARGGAS